jgi:hypothetical protein
MMANEGSSRKRQAPLLRELEYRARGAFVFGKRLLGISSRADKTYFVDRLDRALRSGRLSADVGILATGKNDGAGSQAQAAMSALCFARAHGASYVHRPFTTIEHAEFAMPDWVKAWEDYYNLGAGERALGSPDDEPIVPIDRIDAPTSGRGCIIEAEHYLHYCNKDPDAWERVMPELRRKFWLNKKPRARQDGTLRVAVHMRRGDVSVGNKKVANNFTPNSTFVTTLTRLRSLLADSGKALTIEVFSQGDPKMFADLAALGADLRLDVPALDTHRALVEADILVMSKGAYSYTAGLLNDGIVLYDPQKYRALQDWAVRSPDGTFDEAGVSARLAALATGA